MLSFNSVLFVIWLDRQTQEHKVRNLQQYPCLTVAQKWIGVHIITLLCPYMVILFLYRQTSQLSRPQLETQG